MRAERKTYEPIWDVDKIEQYFAGRHLPITVMLNKYTVVIDVPNMIKSHIAIIRAQNGNPLYKRYYIRLKQLKRILENDSKQE